MIIFFVMSPPLLLFVLGVCSSWKKVSRLLLPFSLVFGFLVHVFIIIISSLFLLSFPLSPN